MRRRIERGLYGGRKRALGWETMKEKKEEIYVGNKNCLKLFGFPGQMRYDLISLFEKLL